MIFEHVRDGVQMPSNKDSTKCASNKRFIFSPHNPTVTTCYEYCTFRVCAPPPPHQNHEVLVALFLSLVFMPTWLAFAEIAVNHPQSIFTYYVPAKWTTYPIPVQVEVQNLRFIGSRIYSSTAQTPQLIKIILLGV